MNFIKTQKMLTQQAEQKDIPLEAALELMRTYLTELRYHTDTPVDRCRIGDLSQVVASLAAVSSDILFVYRTNEKDIHAEESRVAQSLAKSQNACSTYHNRIAKLDEQIHEEQAVREQLNALLEKEQSRNSALAQLQQQNAVIRTQIDALSVEDPETEAGKLKAQLEVLSGKLARATDEYSRIQQEHAGKQQALEDKNRCVLLLQGSVDKAVAELQENERIICELENQLKCIQQEIAHRRMDIAAVSAELKTEQEESELLLEQQVILSVDLETQKTDNQNFRSDHLEPIKVQLTQMTAQAQQDQAKLVELKDSIKQLEGNRAAIAQETAIVKLKLKSKEAALDTVQAEYERNKQAVAALEEDLRVKGAESSALLEREKELRELLNEKNVARITEELENCNKRLEEDISQAEQTEKDLAIKQQELQILQQKLSAVQKELGECRSQETKLLDGYNTASRELDRITCMENRQRCEKLYNQLQVMQAMLNQLAAPALVPCGEGFSVQEQLKEELTRAEQTLRALRGIIREYTSLRQNSLEPPC